MKKIIKVLGLVAVLGVILTVVLAGTALAAGPNSDNGAQNQGAICNCDGCPRGDCTCDGSNCEPKLWEGPPPHDQQATDSTGSGTQTQNHGAECYCDECPRGDGICDGDNCTTKLQGGRGPHRVKTGN